MIAVTGASGFIGRSVVEALGREGIAARSLTRQDLAGIAGEGPRGKCDSELSKKLETCDAVINCAGVAHGAARNAAANSSINHHLPIRLAEASAEAGVKRIVQISSIAVHGVWSSSVPLSEHSPIAPTTPYGTAKARAEQGLQDVSEKRKIGVTALRPTLVCGADAPGSLALLCRLLRMGAPFPLVRTNKRDMTGVRNLAHAAMTLAVKPRKPGYDAYVVSDGRPLSTAEIVDAISKGMGRSPRFVPLPAVFLRAAEFLPGLGASIAQFARDFRVDSSKLWQDIGQTPQIATEDELMACGASAREAKQT